MFREHVLMVVERSEEKSQVHSTVGHLYNITLVHSLREARAALPQRHFALILTAPRLGDGSAVDFLKEIRAGETTKAMPIIFLSTDSSPEQKVSAFNEGADDFIVLPFEPLEFTARIQAKLKKAGPVARPFVSGCFEVDSAAHRTFILSRNQKTELKLTPIEFRLFVHFVRHEGKILSRSDIVSSVWGSEIHLSKHTVDTHVSSLRKKLGAKSHCIKAVVKQGYCYTPEQTEKIA